jgi:hypothetical protein
MRLFVQGFCEPFLPFLSTGDACGNDPAHIAAIRVDDMEDVRSCGSDGTDSDFFIVNTIIDPFDYVMKIRAA